MHNKQAIDKAMLTLNLVYFDNRLQELGLKQWWLAEQLGVDRKTIGRWLTGQTKKIKKTNLQKLATILQCPATDLTLSDDNLHFADAKQQALAAQLIEQENLVEILTPSGNWVLLEGLIKASLRPELPFSLLGELYNYLCIAAWRQSQLDKATDYLNKALEIAQQCGHQRVYIRARLNQATLCSFKGQLAAAIDSYHYCIENEQYIDDPMVKAAAYSNLGCVYQEVGDLKQAAIYQQQAICLFSELDKPVNLAIAWIGLCDVLLEQGQLSDAWQACEQSLQFVKKSQMKRGFADCQLFFSLVLSAQGQYEESLSHWQQANQLFNELAIEESRTYLAGALCYAGLQQTASALQMLDKGFLLAKEYPVEMAQLYQARFTFTKNPQDALQALNIFKKTGATQRAVDFQKQINKSKA